MRLDKFVSNHSDFSRNDVKKLIRQGEITVNGEVASRPESAVSENDRVEVCGEPVCATGPRYFMLYKPQGFVSATRDRRNPTVLDLLDEPRKQSLHVAGRLDIDTTGLVLLTDDGQWSHRITSPHHQCFKRYRVETELPITDNTIQHFTRGLHLPDEKKRCLPAQVELIDSHTCWLSIQEGKHHQIKRMFAAMNNSVLALHRVAIGHILLDDALTEGEYRPLTAAEIQLDGLLP